MDMKLKRSQLILPIFGVIHLLSTDMVLATKADTMKEPTLHSQESTLESKSLVSNGDTVELKRLGISISPLEKWVVSTNHMGMTMVIEGPKPSEIVYDKITLRPNLTIATKSEPAPIDDVFAQGIIEKLADSIKQASGAESTVIDKDYSYFNFRNYAGAKPGKGLVIYSRFSMGETEIQQIHIYVSGEKRLFHLTYTDLASELTKDEVFDQVWGMISTFKVTGYPNARYSTLASVGTISLILICLLGVALWLHNRRFKLSLQDDVIYDEDDPLTWDNDESQAAAMQSTSELWETSKSSTSETIEPITLSF